MGCRRAAVQEGSSLELLRPAVLCLLFLHPALGFPTTPRHLCNLPCPPSTLNAALEGGRSLITANPYC